MATTTIVRPDVSREEFDDLCRRFAALEQQVADRRNGLLPGDASLATALLPALAIVLGGEAFLADFVADVQDPNVRFIAGHRSTQAIGKFLARIQGRAFGGFLLAPDGRVHNRRQWRLRRVV
jgi:hypothetical protein